MGLVRFIASSENARLLKQYLQDGDSLSKRDLKSCLYEAISLPVYQHIFKKHGQKFEIVTVEEFLQDPDPKNVNIIFDGSVEPFLYSALWNPPLPLDGRAALTILGDKFTTYKVVKGLPEVRQPKTLPLHGHLDLATALSEISTPKIVVKPRFFTYESQNVLLLERSRLENVSADEKLNFSGCVLQEYLEDTLWPPQEWRFHFVGRVLCRVMKITDKNNWGMSFKHENIALDQTPEEFKTLAEKVAKSLVDAKNRDNFTLDFLLGEKGLIFLEANVGNLGSFCLQTEEEASYVEPILLQWFRHLERLNRS